MSYFEYNWTSWQQEQQQKSPYFDLDTKKTKFYFDLQEEYDDCSSIEEEEELIFVKNNTTVTNKTSLLSQMLHDKNNQISQKQSSSSLKRCQSNYQHLNEWFSSP